MSRIKKYHQQNHKVALQDLTKNKKSVILLRKLYSEVFGIEDHTIQALDTYLRDKSGFSNCTLAADAMDLKKEYSLILELSDTVKLNNYNQKGEPTKEVLKALEDEFTVYYTNEEIKLLDEVNEVVKAMNSISKYDAQAIRFNTLDSKFVFIEQMANTNKQFANRK